MYRIDTSTSSSSKPTIPSAGTEQYFQDISSGGGTIVPAWFLTMIQEEIRNVVVDAGLTPDKDDDTQLSSAISALVSLGGPYLHARGEQTSGTGGQVFSAATWTARNITTVKTNGIDDASLASNQITLPAGTYRVAAISPWIDTSTADPSNVGHCRVRNITGGTTLATGTNAQSDYTDGENDPETAISIAKDDFTLTVESVIELQHYSTYSAKGGAAVSSGEIETYADIEFWQLST